MMKINVSGVHHHEIQAVWPYVRPFMEKLIKRPEGQTFNWIYREDFMISLLLERKVQLWVGWLDSGEIVGFALTEVKVYGDKAVCEIFAAAGDDSFEKNWEHLITEVEEWAKHVEKCHAVAVNGRIGWKKVLGNSGYELSSVTLMKVLTDEDHNSGSPPVESVH